MSRWIRIMPLALALLASVAASQAGCDAFRGDNENDDDRRLTRERGGDPPTGAVNPGAEPRLIEAARTGDLQEVRQLVRRGADVNAFGKGRQTALIAAAQRGRREIVNVLLEAGADANLRDAKGNTAAEAAANRGHSRIAETLRQAEVRPPPGPAKPVAAPEPRPNRPRQ